MGIPHALFEEKLEDMKLTKGVDNDTDLTASDLRELVGQYKNVYIEAKGEPFPSGLFIMFHPVLPQTPCDSSFSGAVDNLLKSCCSYWFDNLGFFLRENLLLTTSYLPLGVSQRTCVSRHQAIFLAPLPGRQQSSARGVSRFQSLYFVFVLLSLLLFYLVCFYLSKT